MYFLNLSKILSMSLLIFVLVSCVLFVNAQTTTATSMSETTTIPAVEYTKRSKGPNFWTIACKHGGGNLKSGCCVVGGCPCPDNRKLCRQCGVPGECGSFCNVTISSVRIKRKSGFSWTVVEPALLNQDCYYTFKGSVGQRVQMAVEKNPGSENLIKTKGTSLSSGNGYVYSCSGNCSAAGKRNDNDNGNNDESRDKLMDLQNDDLSSLTVGFLSATDSITLLIKNPGIQLLVTATFVDAQRENFPMATTSTSASTLISSASQPQTTEKATTSYPKKNKEKASKSSKNPTLEETVSTFSTTLAPTTTQTSIQSTKNDNDNNNKSTKKTTTETPLEFSFFSPTQPSPIDEKLLLKNPVYMPCNSKLDPRMTFGHTFRLQVTHVYANSSSSGKNAYKDQGRKLARKIRHCSLTFELKSPNQAVQLVLFNYHLRGEKCSTTIVINSIEKDEADDSGLVTRRLDLICGSTPIKTRRYTTGPNGVRMSLDIYFSDEQPLPTNEFLEGVFRFHDELKDGALKRDTLCDVVHDAQKLKTGHVVIPNPTDSFFYPHQLLLPTDCFHHFMPNKNSFRLEHVLLMIQSTYTKDVNVSLERGVESVMKRYPKCYTVCRDEGCSCQVTGSNTLGNVDHLILFSQRKELLEIGCFCGPFGKNVPIFYESDVPLILKHHRVSPVVGSDMKEMIFAIKFSFSLHGNGYCSRFMMEPPGSTKQGIDLIKGVEFPGSHFHYQNFFCSWLLKNSASRELNIEVLFLGNPQKKHDCKQWDFRILGTFIDFHQHDQQKELFSLCPLTLANSENNNKTGNKTQRNSFKIPGTVSHGLIQVNGTVKEIPDFALRWSYNNTKEKDGNRANFLYFHHPIFLVPFLLLFFNGDFINLY